MLDFSKISDGTETYMVKDSEARDSIEELEKLLADYKAMLVAQTNRVSSLSSIPSGSTSLDSEVIDIRTGADGTVYPLAGDAVRTQFDSQSTRISELTDITTIKYTNLHTYGLADFGSEFTLSSSDSVCSLHSYKKYPLDKDYSYVILIKGTISGTFASDAIVRCQIVKDSDNTSTFSTDIAGSSGYAPTSVVVSDESFVVSSALKVDSDEEYEIGILLDGNTGTSIKWTIDDMIVIKIPYGTTESDAKDLIKSFYNKYSFRDEYYVFRGISDSTDEIKTIANSEALTVVNKRLAEVMPETSDTNQYLDYWGDEITLGNQDSTGITRATVMKGYLDRTTDTWVVSNFGKDGETSNTVACRQGGMNFVCKAGVTIPSLATELVKIELTDNMGNTVNPKEFDVEDINPVYISDVEGRLYLSANNIYFSRSESGSKVVITRPTNVITNASRLHQSHNMIISVGDNGGFSVENIEDFSDVENLIRQINSMIDHCTSDNYLVCGLIKSDNAKDINKRLLHEYGRKFVDALDYITTPIYANDGTTIQSCYGLDDAGLSMTTDDLVDIQNGVLPTSLRVDGTKNPNSYGYRVMATLEYNRGKELNYWG